ncbi:MAG: hypothetical protein WC897_03265 [Candidatus Gracilibacteria bacterium]
MGNQHTQKRQEPDENLQESSQVLPESRNDDSFGLGTELIEGKVSEIAGNVSEKKSDSGKKATTQQKDDRSPKVIAEEDRTLLRERLLKNAPKEPEMRRQIKEILLKKKIFLEKDVSKYSRKGEYHPLSIAIANLRSVVRQLEIVAQASYEILREIWLRVVHKFA